MTVQLVIRVPDDVVAAIDDLIEQGVFTSRSDAVRTGLIDVIDRRRRASLGKAIADGYRRLPQADEEAGWPDTASAAMIAPTTVIELLPPIDDLVVRPAHDRSASRLATPAR
jgi:Arc/MetJ-type ribon-helix-helix transcriptional regulator